MSATVAKVLVVLRFEAYEGFQEAATDALAVLSERPGYRGGQLARAYDDPGVWCLVTEWESVGAYRRALGSYDVKMRATTVLSRALPEPSAYEPLVVSSPGEPVQVTPSDLSAGGSLPSRP
jgi:heme oxygenase (mycobilin-producing)